MKAVVYLNGKFVTGRDARVSLCSSGLLYGYGLFETMRVLGQWIVALDRHLARMYEGARFMGLPLMKKSAMKAAIAETVRRNSLSDAALRLTKVGLKRSWADATKIGTRASDGSRLHNQLGALSRRISRAFVWQFVTWPVAFKSEFRIQWQKLFASSDFNAKGEQHVASRTDLVYLSDKSQSPLGRTPAVLLSLLARSPFASVERISPN